MNADGSLTRRDFVAATVAAGVTLSGRDTSEAAAKNESKAAHKICAFCKPFQSLTYDELADRMAELGFDGIEATIRNGGHIKPAQAKDELPKMVEALRKRGLEITVMASSINRADQPHAEDTLRTAAALGVKRYRMAYFRYDLNRPVVDQLDELRPVLKDLAALNRELGIAAVYQNHAGTKNVGAPLWDLHSLIRDYPVDQIGAAFDIRHAAVEGGLCWPVHFNLMRPHLGIVYVKDFRWNGRKVGNVPLGKGMVDPKFFKMLRKSGYGGPISLHEEYLDHRKPELVPKHLEAMRKDLETLRSWLKA